MTHGAPCKLLYTLEPWMGSKGQDIFFAEEIHVEKHIKRKDVLNILQVNYLENIPDLLGWAKMSYIEIVQISIF